MIVFLDHLIFGNGKGLKSPSSDNVMYWLYDTVHGKSQIYLWDGWFGSQLKSFQWIHPKAHETRFLCGREFKPFSSRRKWGRVMVSWQMVGDKTNGTVLNLQKDLREL